MIMDPIYGQISYNCCLPNAFMLKLGHNPKIFLVKPTWATEQQIAQHIIRPATIITASHIKTMCAPLLIIRHRVWKVLKMVEERRERRMVGKNDTCINVSSDWKNRIDCIASIYNGSNRCISVKYLTLRSISGVSEYEPIRQAYIWVTERDLWVWNKHRQSCKEGLEASGGWWECPRSSKFQLSI